MSIEHYENFPVASWLCPAALRPAVTAIYHFARTADDLADEGDATPAQRLADLAAYRRDLMAVAAPATSGTSNTPSPRWARVFSALRETLARHALPLNLLTDLLSAFEQDVVKHAYADRAELLDYCRRSANPVGRLLLHLYGVTGEHALAQSDAICTALQLINFWQDLGPDTRHGRCYLPQKDAARHGVTPADLATHVAARRDTPATRALMAEMTAWARGMMASGAGLVHAVPGRAGFELRLVVQGGLRILDKIEAMNHACLTVRPTLRPLDAAPMLWRALWMRAPAATAARGPA